MLYAPARLPSGRVNFFAYVSVLREGLAEGFFGLSVVRHGLGHVSGRRVFCSGGILILVVLRFSVMSGTAGRSVMFRRSMPFSRAGPCGRIGLLRFGIVRVVVFFL